MLWTQIEIGLDLRNNFYYSGSWKEDMLTIQNGILYWNQYDLVSKLDKASSESDRLNIMNQYVNEASEFVKKSNSAFSFEKQKVDEYNQEYSKCESQIDGKNTLFQKAVKSYNYWLAESISDEIAELRACMARNQVYARAHASYASETKQFNSLKNKVNYIAENRFKIAKYYEILKPDLLKDLYNVSQTVNVNF